MPESPSPIFPATPSKVLWLGNKYIISIADNVVFGALDPTSSLTNLVEEQKLLGIEIHASV